MNILITEHCAPFSEANKDRLREAAGGENIQFLSRISDNSEFLNALAEADVVIGNLSAQELKTAGKLKLLQSTNAGVDAYTGNPDFPAKALLANCSGAFGGVISEYILGGLIALCRLLPQYHEQQKKALWQCAGTELHLEGKTALILGCGDIGTQTAKRLKAFDVKTVGVRKHLSKPACHFDEVHSAGELDSLLGEADFVIGCMPGTPENTGLFDRERLLLMKKSAILVNVGRGSLIDTDALASVLASGHLFGAVLDVVSPEPLPPEHPLWKLENVILTPHISGISFGHAEKVEKIITDICCGNLAAFRENRPLCNLVEERA